MFKRNWETHGATIVDWQPIEEPGKLHQLGAPYDLVLDVDGNEVGVATRRVRLECRVHNDIARLLRSGNRVTVRVHGDKVELDTDALQRQYDDAQRASSDRMADLAAAAPSTPVERPAASTAAPTPTPAAPSPDAVAAAYAADNRDEILRLGQRAEAVVIAVRPMEAVGGLSGGTVVRLTLRIEPDGSAPYMSDGAAARVPDGKEGVLVVGNRIPVVFMPQSPLTTTRIDWDRT